MRPEVVYNRKAFTLLEIIIVIIMIGIMSAMVLPRLTGNRSREFTLTAERVADVVLMYAHRNATSNQPSALQYNMKTKELALLIKVEDEGERYWEYDPLAKPIYLPSWLDGESLSIFADGDYIDTSQWPLTSSPGEARPLIELTLDWENRSSAISLAPHAVGPKLWLDGMGTEPLMPIDLDAEGRGQEEW